MHTYTKTLIKLTALALIVWAIMFAVAGTNAQQADVIEGPQHDAKRAPLTLPTTTTTTLPDFSGVDFVAVGQAIEEDRRIAQQMAIDEARMLYGKCGEWKLLAEQVGWPESEWPILSYVLHRESRCNINSHNQTDPASGSRGLMQINGYWCRPSKYSQNGWLQDRGILNTCDDLFQPEINLKAGYAIWLYGEEKHGCGWRGPWATPCQ
jgi:hypothetical protein